MLLKHVELDEANAFVARLHRHHKPAQGHRFSVAAWKNGKLVGVAIVGRPVWRGYPPDLMCEVTRLCTDGTRNACSFLYGASARAIKALGYEEGQTYILDRESGVSLRAAGWQLDRFTKGRAWDYTTAPQRDLWGHTRRQDQPTCDKQRWFVRFDGGPTMARRAERSEAASEASAR